MADQPSPPASAGPRAPAQGSIALEQQGPFDRRLADSIANPLPSPQSHVPVGRALYGIYCVPCHGSTGAGVDGPVARYFPRVGDLRASDVQRHGDGWLYAVITSGTDLMPASGHELDPQERWAIVAFVRTLAP